ncbi:MAG: helix-turn-helix transcriptional regulator [Firmicutes bacterium]|nr:helix-turn-helix transcriptional regulator [Bacillota bacterium]
MNEKPQNDMNWIGLNITYYRRNKKMKQKELAEAIPISKSYMSEIETSKSIPAVDLIFKIADVLEIPVYKLFEER